MTVTITKEQLAIALKNAIEKFAAENAKHRLIEYLARELKLNGLV